MRYHIVMPVLLGLFVTAGGAWARVANISGIWTFSVDTGSGAQPNGTLVFKQQDEKLSGTYDGAMGVHKFTGTVHGNKVEFSFYKTFPGREEPFNVVFTGVIESANTLAGTFEHPKGRPNWTATKK